MLCCKKDLPCMLRASPAVHQVQDRLTGFIMTAAAVWCILAMVTIVLQSTGSGHAVTPLWWAPRLSIPLWPADEDG